MAIGRPHAGAGGDAQHIRSHQGVFEDALVAGAGQGERSTDHDRRQHPRQAECINDTFRLGLPGPVQREEEISQYGHHVSRRNIETAHTDTDHRRRKEKDQKEEEQCGKLPALQVPEESHLRK